MSKSGSTASVQQNFAREGSGCLCLKNVLRAYKGFRCTADAVGLNKVSRVIGYRDSSRRLEQLWISCSPGTKFHEHTDQEKQGRRGYTREEPQERDETPDAAATRPEPARCEKADDREQANSAEHGSGPKCPVHEYSFQS